MDIRNITENPLEVSDPKEYLSKMFDLGIEQLEGYRIIENLPAYPFDINTAKNQVILKDFIGRVIEELTEGHESLLLLNDILNPIGYNINRLDNKEYNQVLNHIQNANEEQADAFGFFFALLTYSNILPEDIFNYAESNGGIDINSTNDLMSFGIKLQNDCGFDVYDNWLSFSFPLVSSDIFTSKFNKTQKDFDKFNQYAPGFHSLSPTHINNGIYLMWQVIYQLNCARNLLKNRPWKQTQVMSKELDYQEAVVKAFILYLGYLGLNGFDQKSIYVLMFKKQRLNLWRQKTGY
jgi:hypothetical protein